MNTVNTTLRTRAAALQMPRFLIVLALALALVAIPAFNPADASAYPMSERQSLRACGSLGGRAHYDFIDSDTMEYNMTCRSQSGTPLFFCWGWDIFVNCWSY